MSQIIPAELAAPKKPDRLAALDAYRGFVMLAMASGGLGIAAIAKSKEMADSWWWQQAARQLEHVEWVGCSFWDLIQPSFMFMVGVSLAYSAASRTAQGQSYPLLLLHAVLRGAALVGLGVFLRSNGQPQTNFFFIDVTSQIGLGYVFLFLLWGRPAAIQFAAALGILGCYWLLFARWPLPAEGFDYSTVGVKDSWKHLPGFAAHWDKNANPAYYFDVWFMNLEIFHRPKPYVDCGGYATLNFIPSLATMIFGVLAGELLRGPRSGAEKMGMLVIAGLLGLAAGGLLDAAGICPLVKRIWTPSWTLFAAGWTCLMLAGFYGVIDLAGWKAWSFPLVVVGMNSIAIYCMTYLTKGFIQGSLKTHLGKDLFSFWGYAPLYEALIQSVVTLLIYWIICYWMYRRKLFLKL